MRSAESLFTVILWLVFDPPAELKVFMLVSLVNLWGNYMLISFDILLIFLSTVCCIGALSDTSSAVERASMEHQIWLHIDSTS